MKKNSRVVEKIAFTILGAATLAVIVPIILLFLLIIIKGAPAISWKFLTTNPTLMGTGGIFPAIIGTLILIIGTVAFALPVGVMSAIYLSEYSRDSWLTRIIKLAIINLAGVPSIIFGLFGLGLFVIFFKFGASILSGSLTLAIMVLPVIITSSKEAFDAVPDSFREVSLSLGASRWQTVRFAVMPYALPGILTGTILGIGRAAGETAPILFTVAAFYLPKLPTSIFDQVMALPYHLYVIATQIPHVPKSTSYGISLVLIFLVFIISISAIVLRAFLRGNRKW